MNQRVLILAIGAAFQLALFSCKKDDETPPVYEQIIPLQVGNQWQYRVYLHDFNGTMYDSTGTYIRTVLRDTTINKSTWYILNDRTIVQNTNQGYAYYNVAGNQPVVIYQASSMGGLGYGYKYSAYDLYVHTLPNHQLRAIPGSRQKYLGNLYQIENTYTYANPTLIQTQKREDWVVPAIGLARWDTFYRDSNKLQRRLELISYTVK